MGWTIYYKGVTGYQGSVTVDEMAVSAGGLELAIIADETNSGGSTTIDGADSLTYADCYDTMYVYRNGVPISDLTTENGKGFLNATLIQDGDSVICTVWTAGNKRERQQIKLGVAQIKRKALMYATPTDAPFYRPNNTFETDDLPTVYNTNGTSLTDNANAEGLLPKRPWTAVGAVAAPASIAESVDSGTLVDLQVWYDGADTSTYVPSATDEGSITQWTDKSSYAHNANPIGGATTRPSYENTTLQNGYGYLEFDDNDGLSINPVAWAQGLSGFTVFVVANYSNPSPAPGQRRPLVYSSSGDFGIVRNHTTGDYSLYADGTSNIDSSFTVETSPDTDSVGWHQVSVIYDGTQASNADKLKFRANKTDQVLNFNSNTVPTTTDAGLTHLYFGTADDGNPSWTGYIAEVIIFSRTLSATEYANVENYLANKWGL